MLMMAPIFPHIADELWHRQGNTSSVHRQRWPIGDPEGARRSPSSCRSTARYDKLAVAPGTPGEELERQALALSNIVKWMDGKQARKIIVVPDKLVNIVDGISAIQPGAVGAIPTITLRFANKSGISLLSGKYRFCQIFKVAVTLIFAKCVIFIIRL